MPSIYVVKSKEPVHYDEYAGFVVRAGSHKHARELCFGEDPSPRWLDAKRSSCSIIHPLDPSKVILSDFRAG